ncbi:MAG: ACT domain-containing protein, partial [Desulfoplanes sp.]
MSDSATKNPWTVLELIVNNHPGVMSHICGLFSRRAFNVEGILCFPDECGTTSRILLSVAVDEHLDQILK